MHTHKCDPADTVPVLHRQTLHIAAVGVRPCHSLFHAFELRRPVLNLILRLEVSRDRHLHPSHDLVLDLASDLVFETALDWALELSWDTELIRCYRGCRIYGVRAVVGVAVAAGVVANVRAGVRAVADPVDADALRPNHRK